MSRRIGYVYAIEGGGLVKIGRALDVDTRLREIQAMSPVPLTVVKTWSGTHQLETWLHRTFAEYRRHGEWFDLPDGWVDRAGEVVASWLRGDPDPWAAAYRAEVEERRRQRRVRNERERWKRMELENPEYVARVRGIVAANQGAA